MALTGITIGGSAGATQVAVPNVVEQPQAAAEQTLRNRGLKPVASLIEADGTEGTVFSQNPAANTAVNRGSTVRLAIIDNPDIPVDIGQSLNEIKAALALVETDDAAQVRNQAVLDKLGTLETDAAADERKQEILDRIDEHDHGKGEPAAARKSSQTRRP